MKLQLALRITLYLLGMLLVSVGSLRELPSEASRRSPVVTSLTAVAVIPAVAPLLARLRLVGRGRARPRNKPLLLKGALEICCAVVRLL